MKPYYVDKIEDRGAIYFSIRHSEDSQIVVMPTKYLNHKMRVRRSPYTRRRMAFSLSYYLNFCDEEGVDTEAVFSLKFDKQYEHFADFLKWIKDGKHISKELQKAPSNNTCNTYLKDVFGYYQFLGMYREQFDELKIFKEQTATFVNSAGVKRTKKRRVFDGFLKGERHTGRSIAQDQLLELLKACTNYRDLVMLLLLAETGFRIGEMLGINYTKDINYEKRLISVYFREDNENGARAKNAEYRSALVSTDTFEILLYYLSEYRELLKNTDYLFVNIAGRSAGKPLNVNTVYAMLGRLEKKTGIEATPHMLRHYFANQRRKSGWDVPLISKALGHRNLETTINYLNIETNELVEASEEYYEKNRHLYMVDELL